MSRGSERKRIRHKVVEMLKRADIQGVGSDVFPGRSINSDGQELPVILIYTKSEAVERNDESPKTYKRILSLEIEISSTHDNDEKLIDELDDLAQYVEDVFEGETDLLDMTHANSKEKLINDYDLSNSIIETEGNGSNPVGSVKMFYSIEYYTDETREQILKDFERMETTYKVQGNIDDDAKEIIEFETGDE